MFLDYEVTDGFSRAPTAYSIKEGLNRRTVSLVLVPAMELLLDFSFTWSRREENFVLKTCWFDVCPERPQLFSPRDYILRMIRTSQSFRANPRLNNQQ